MVHGHTPEDVKKDLEGLQTMRVLGRNMAWFLKCKEAGIKADIPFPKREETIFTNFIREWSEFFYANLTPVQTKLSSEPWE